MSKKSENLYTQVEHRINQLKEDLNKLQEIEHPETISVENFDYVPIAQEVIKDDEDEEK